MIPLKMSLGLYFLIVFLPLLALTDFPFADDPGKQERNLKSDLSSTESTSLMFPRVVARLRVSDGHIVSIRCETAGPARRWITWDGPTRPVRSCAMPQNSGNKQDFFEANVWGTDAPYSISEPSLLEEHQVPERALNNTAVSLSFTDAVS